MARTLWGVPTISRKNQREDATTSNTRESEDVGKREMQESEGSSKRKTRQSQGDAKGKSRKSEPAVKRVTRQSEWDAKRKTRQSEIASKRNTRQSPKLTPKLTPKRTPKLPPKQTPKLPPKQPPKQPPNQPPKQNRKRRRENAGEGEPSSKIPRDETPPVSEPLLLIEAPPLTVVDPVEEENEDEAVEDRLVPAGYEIENSDDDFGGVEEDETDRVVPPAERFVNPGEIPVTPAQDCGLEEEEFDDLGGQFGVNDAAEDLESESEEEVDDDDDKVPDPLSSDDEDAEFARLTSTDNDAQVSDDDPSRLLKLGKCFCTREDFKIAILKYSLWSRYDIKIYKSQANKLGAKCNDKEGNCGWRCYASYDKKKHKMQIKVFVDVHTCVRSGYSKLLKQGTVAWLFADRLRVNPKMSKEEMAAEIKREYNLVVSTEVCGNAKKLLAKQRRQSHEANFSRIWDYQAEVLLSNEGSVFEIETIPGPRIGSKQRFYRLFMCFKSQRDTWKTSCRPIIGVDGAFLKWDIKGHLLAAVGRDGDNRIVPIAWAVVEIENDDNWDWFIRHLSGNLGLGDGKDVAILSDKQKGLVKAVQTVLPHAEHRQCARHIMDNWKRDSHDMELQRMFWKIARSYNKGEFAAHMDALQQYSPNSYASLLKTYPATWSRAFFRTGSCCPDVLNNLCESFNRTIRAARKKPLLELLEDIRRQCMVRNERRSRMAERLQTRFTKRAHLEIEMMVSSSRHCTLFMARNNYYEVDFRGNTYRVNMNDSTCGCRKWEITGIPCVHATAVIIAKKQKVEDYVSQYYSTEMWRKTYEDGIKPVQGELLWPRLNRLGVLPPPWRKGNPGRPSNYARKKSVNESQQPSTKLGRENRVMTCSNCKQDGHNKKTCTNERVQLPKRGRGRPKKYQV